MFDQIGIVFILQKTLEEGVHAGFGNVFTGATEIEAFVPFEMGIEFLPSLQGVDGIHLRECIGDPFAHVVRVEAQKFDEGRNGVGHAKGAGDFNSEHRGPEVVEDGWFALGDFGRFLRDLEGDPSVGAGLKFAAKIRIGAQDFDDGFGFRDESAGIGGFIQGALRRELVQALKEFSVRGVGEPETLFEALLREALEKRPMEFLSESQDFSAVLAQEVDGGFGEQPFEGEVRARFVDLLMKQIEEFFGVRALEGKRTEAVVVVECAKESVLLQGAKGLAGGVETARVAAGHQFEGVVSHDGILVREGGDVFLSE